ncbi:glycerol kinase [Gemmobacter aquatilis]|uniref:glycerol kinase n=1 Tax=Gemmobacter aquatilis TaxID=933059 RepID=A0A1H8DSR2_9RHOB|nr:glycerol kinase GlpK [Gemmobacter aquatilis]SEN10270.1 glycerol kinase [Gemmobacter aquatilis]
MTHILAIDQGTTSTRAILFDAALRVVSVAQRELTQHFPASGWVEHDAEEIWQSVLACGRQAMAGGQAVAAIGITNQRETTLLWDRATGEVLHRAIVWQDRRTAERCAQMKAEGMEEMVTARTGLLLDPYFSASKLGWLLETVPGAKARAERGALAFGTVDSFLIWRLTGGRVHATDATNAARTMLYDIGAGRWDADLCALFGVPMAVLPEVKDCAAEFGVTDAALFGQALPILGVAGDQQAATVGQACFAPGMMKSTYGTGCFALLNTGAAPVRSSHRMLTTIAYQLDGVPTYALEGAIFVAGAVVQWLRDGLGVIGAAGETQALAERAAEGVVLVPAFTGLGAPYWRPDCRGAVFGLTRGSGPAELARAALETVGYQTRDLLAAMQADWGTAGAAVLRVDGGMARSDWAMQFLADILGAPVDRPGVTETTALGAAWLAGQKAGLCPGPAGFAAQWALERRFEPAMGAAERAAKYARWQRAVAATMMF